MKRTLVVALHLIAIAVIIFGCALIHGLIDDYQWCRAVDNENAGVHTEWRWFKCKFEADPLHWFYPDLEKPLA